MADEAAAPAPAPPPATPTAVPAAPPAQPDLAPVIDVGGASGAAPGQPGSQFVPVYHGIGSAPSLPPGDDKVRRDFLAGRALAQAGDPWSQLDTLIEQTKAAKGAAPSPNAAGEQDQNGERAANPQSPDDERPIGRKLTQAAQGVVQQDEESGPSLDSLLSLPGKILGSHAAMERDLQEHGLPAAPFVPQVGAVAKDIGLGIIQTPQAVLRGMLGAVEQGSKAALSVGDAVNKVIPEWLSRVMPMGEALGQMTGGPGRAGLEYVANSAAEDKSEIPEPTTITGNLIEQGTQFGAGLKGAKPLMEAAGASGTVGHLLSDLTAGATTMDPNAPRLSNLLDEVAPNFVSDWLAAKPGQDNAVMNRLKSGLEFAGLGAMFEGLKQGLSVLKPMIQAPRGVDINGKPSQATVETRDVPRTSVPTTEPPEGVLPPGMAKPPLIEVNPKIAGMAETVLEQQQGMERLPPGEAGAPTSLPPDQVRDYIEGRNTDNPIRINLLRIGSGDDVRNVLEEVARMIPEPPVQSHAETIRLADALGLTPEDFLSGYQGHALNAVEATAFRMMLDSSAEQLIEYAKAAVDPAVADDVAKTTFVRAFATHWALQLYGTGARAEAGRTLNAFSILSQGRAGYAQAIKQIVEQGGEQNITQMAADVASLDDPLQVSRLVRASQLGTGRDTFLKVFYNVLLSNPRTVVKKLASDAGMAMWNLATTYGAENFGSGAVVPGEAAQLGYGYLASLKDAFRMAGKGLKAGESQFFRQFQTMDWQDQSRLSWLANGAPEMIPDDEPTKAGTSWLRAALPTSWIGAADDFAKYLNYRAYLRALAFRDGSAKGLEGPDLATHVAQTLDNVPDSIHQEALANTLRSTFQEPLTGVALQFEQFVDAFNLPVAHSDFKIPVGRIILPFIKVPTNIMRWSYRNSALSVALPSESFRAELNAGGATRDMAMARVWLGSALALGVADLALNNTITGRGPSDPQLQRAWRAAGNEPYSIQLPGQRPVSYNQVEPLGLMMGAIADTFNIMKFAREDGRGSLAASIAFGTGNALLSKTYLEGVANLFEAMNAPDRDGARVANSMILPFVSPQGVAAVARSIDPWRRAHYDLMDSIEARLPIVSESLPPARTLWGDPIPQRDAYLPFMPSDGFVPKLLSPVSLGPRPEDVQPIDRWIWDNRASFPHATSNQLGITKPSQFQSFNVGHGIAVQVHLTPQQYDHFQELAGNGLKDPSTGLGARDTLNSLVTGTSRDRDMQDAWNQSSPALKALMVQHIVNRYRSAARKMLVQEYSDIADTIAAGAKTRASQLTH